jgi:hypothetical protein
MSKIHVIALLFSLAVNLPSAGQGNKRPNKRPNQKPETAARQQDFAPKLLVPHDVKSASGRLGA